METTTDIETAAAPLVAGSSSSPSWQDQDDQLRDMWMQHVSPEEIASQLNRTVAAIMTRAVRLGLPRRAAPGRKLGYKVDPSARRACSAAHKRLHQPLDKLIQHATVAEAECRMTTMRVCLMCLNKFPSLGSFNRICNACKNTSEFNAHSGLPEDFRDE